MSREPIEPSKSFVEKRQRIKALHFINTFLDCIKGWSYATRSELPNHEDFTEFTSKVDSVRSFLNARPDWNSDMLKKAFDITFLANEEEQEQKLKEHYEVKIT